MTKMLSNNKGLNLTLPGRNKIIYFICVNKNLT